MLRPTSTLAALLATLLAGCLGTALPQPPNYDPIDPTLVVPSFPEAVPGELVLEGAPGALPANTFVAATDLDGVAPAVLSEARADGSFTVSIDADRGHVIRLQVRAPDGRSEPTDLLAESALPVERPACLAVPLEVDLSEARVVDVPLDNACGEDVVVRDAGLRVGEAALDVDVPSEVRIPDGARVLVTVRALGAGAVEDVLFLEATLQGGAHRYPITIHAAAR